MADIRGDIRHRDTDRHRYGPSDAGRRLAEVIIQMTDRKKPGVAFLATVVVLVLVVAYPLSYGPYLAIRQQLPEGIGNVIDAAYTPLIQLILNGPDLLIKPYISYLKWWSESAMWYELAR
jgi:hypothetical protein